MLLYYIKISLKYGGISTWSMFFIQLLGGILPILELFLTAEFIDRTLELLRNQADVTEILPVLFLWGLVIGLTWFNKEVGNFVTIKLTHHLRERFRPVLVERIAKLPYRVIEEKEIQDHIHRIMKDPEKEIVDGVYHILGFIAIGIRILGIVFLIGSHVWWCGVLLFLLNIPLIYLAKLNGETVFQANQEMSGHMRRYQYLEQLLSGRDALLERNLFGFHRFLQKKWKKVYDKAYHSYIRAFFKYFFAARGYGVLSALFSVGMILLLINPLITGKITSGVFISAASQLLNVVSVMIQHLSEMLRQLLWKRNYMKDLVNFFRLPEEQQTVLDAPKEAFAGFEEIVFDHVSFRYPGTETYVLKDVSFRLEAGHHYAFTGENAAGKTTIIKLMTSLYDTYEGNIFVNGKELREYSPQEKRSLYAVVYQDFAKYHISVQDMIALGIREKCDETAQRRKVQEAITQVGLLTFVFNLINGADTELGKFEEGNAEASSGQWQRLAIARALVNDAPICILDEPSASLDPVSEKKLYEEYGKLSKGKTTVFISHRLGSVQLADKIFVFDKGVIAEQGTFEDLIKRDSKFKEMYEAQRSWYE